MLAEVKKPTTRHGGETPVHDPLAFELGDLLREIEQSPLEPVNPPKPQGTDDYGNEIWSSLDEDPPADSERQS